jgi:hypothetical protein
MTGNSASCSERKSSARTVTPYLSLSSSSVKLCVCETVQRLDGGNAPGMGSGVRDQRPLFVPKTTERGSKTNVTL